MANIYEAMNVRQKLAKARLYFLNQKVQKSGKNMHLEFKYFELEDIVPPATRIFARVGLTTEIDFTDDGAVMKVYNVDNIEEAPMAHFESVCKKKLVDWYHKNKPGVEIDLSNVFVVWACKTLQNYKCLASTTISGDGIYAEYTYNGDKQELYEDVYGKLTNTCITEE